MGRWGCIVVATVWGLSSAAVAVERSSPEGAQPAVVGSRPSMLQPLYLFNMRGRRDPFVNVLGWSSDGSGIFNISALQFKGVIEVDGQTSALFVATTDRAAYTLRGSRLFGSNDKPVAGVSGRFINATEVTGAVPTSMPRRQ